MTLSEADRAALLAVARAALAAAVAGEHYEPQAPEGSATAAMLEPRGCFVTLKTAGRLRGCIGCFSSDEPLYRTVARYAALSATADPRFAASRITPAELDAVKIDISALSPLVPCPDPEKIILGTHGIYVSQGGRSGCFLPQVASETGWSVTEFWGHCCRDKAGLAWDAWRDTGTTTMTFTAEVFEG